MELWRYGFRGGPWDGETLRSPADPPALIYLWRCLPVCRGHVVDDVAHIPELFLPVAVCYRRDDVDVDARAAVYVLGDVEEDGSDALVEEFVQELLGAR